jgi:hypothetical protein
MFNEQNGQQNVFLLNFTGEKLKKWSTKALKNGQQKIAYFSKKC